MTVRYVVTAVGKDGHRMLLDPQQGAFTYETAAIAQARADVFKKEIEAKTDMRKLEVRPVDCWANQVTSPGDPKVCFFDYQFKDAGCLINTEDGIQYSDRDIIGWFPFIYRWTHGVNSDTSMFYARARQDAESLIAYWNTKSNDWHYGLEV